MGGLSTKVNIIKYTIWYILLYLYHYCDKMMSIAVQTRKFIMERTAPVFNAKELSGTSMNDLTSVTGLTKGSIYGNFANMDEEDLAAFNHNFGSVVTDIRLKMESPPKMIDKLLVYSKTNRNFLQIPFQEAGCPLFNKATEACDPHPMLRKKSIHALKLWKVSVEKCIERKEVNAGTYAAEFSAILMTERVKFFAP